MRLFAKFTYLAAGAALLICSTASAGSISWEAFSIRGGGVANELEPGSVEFITTASGDKAGYGTSEFDGGTFADLVTMEFTIDNAGGPWMPYVNIWITDGTNYAVIANEPSDAPLATYVPGGQATDGTVVSVNFADMDYKIYEHNGNLAWLGGDTDITYAELVGYGYTIGDPNPGTAWGGTGAPKNNTGFNFIYGDTLSNYVSEGDGYVISNITINGMGAAPVPEPATMLLLGTGLAGIVAARRKKIAG